MELDKKSQGTGRTMDDFLLNIFMKRFQQDRGCLIQHSEVYSLDHSSNVYVFPIDKLQRPQRGIKFSIDVAPPFDSGIL